MSLSSPEKPNEIVVGVIVGSHGVKGAVKIKSFCHPPEQIFKYKPWRYRFADEELQCSALHLKASGDFLIARLPDIDSPELAQAYRGVELRILRSQLPATAPGEYYWQDLVGLSVFGLDGFAFGTVRSLFETGSNDVMVVQGDRERLIPYTPGHHVQSVNLAEGRILVDWDPEF